MKYYIVPDESSHYFYVRNQGIFKKTVSSKMEPKSLLPTGLGDFALFRDEVTHIIAVSAENDIYYIQSDRTPIKIMTGKDDIKPYDFTVVKNTKKLIMFYKTDYDGETLLLRCTLTPDSKPKLIGTLSSSASHYCCAGGKLYYTAADNVLVCRSAASSGEETKICLGGEMPYSVDIAGKNHLLYKCGNNIVLNDNFVAFDEHIENPVMFLLGELMYIQWKSGCFIRYMTSADGERWSDIKRYIGIGKEPQIITIALPGSSYCCYGYDGIPFSVQKQHETQLPPDTKIRQELSEIKQQVKILKEEIKKVNSAYFFDKNEKQ